MSAEMPVTESESLIQYAVDVVCVIDSALRMQSYMPHIRDTVRALYPEILKEATLRRRLLRQYRQRIILYRNYLADEASAVVQTDFFRFPEQMKDFETEVDSIDAYGGSRGPSDGLEALAYAIRSDWAPAELAQKRLQLIFVWSDDTVHPYGYCKAAAHYPAGFLPEDMDMMRKWWGDTAEGGYMDSESKRLILLTPAKMCWQRLVACWDNVTHLESKAGVNAELLPKLGEMLFG